MSKIGPVSAAILMSVALLIIWKTSRLNQSHRDTAERIAILNPYLKEFRYLAPERTPYSYDPLLEEEFLRGHRDRWHIEILSAKRYKGLFYMGICEPFHELSVYEQGEVQGSSDALKFFGKYRKVVDPEMREIVLEPMMRSLLESADESVREKLMRYNHALHSTETSSVE